MEEHSRAGFGVGDEDFDDSGWKSALVWEQKRGRGTAGLQPWIPDGVKELWKV